MFIIGIAIMVGQFILNFSDEETGSSTKISRSFGNLFLTIVLGIIFTGVGEKIPTPSNSCMIIEKIDQKKSGYIIYTENNMEIYQKECSYKAGDTLWIKR
jgi:hypothetical protein